MNYTEALAAVSTWNKITRPSWSGAYVELRKCNPQIQLIQKHPHKIETNWSWQIWCADATCTSATDYVTV